MSAEYPWADDGGHSNLGGSSCPTPASGRGQVIRCVSAGAVAPHQFLPTRCRGPSEHVTERAIAVMQYLL